MSNLNQAIADLQSKLEDAIRREREAAKEQKSLHKALQLLKDAAGYLNGYASEEAAATPAPAATKQVATKIARGKQLPWKTVFSKLLENGPLVRRELVIEAARKNGVDPKTAGASLAWLQIQGNVKKLPGHKVSWVE